MRTQSDRLFHYTFAIWITNSLFLEDKTMTVSTAATNWRITSQIMDSPEPSNHLEISINNADHLRSTKQFSFSAFYLWSLWPRRSRRTSNYGEENSKQAKQFSRIKNGNYSNVVCVMRAQFIKISRRPRLSLCLFTKSFCCRFAQLATEDKVKDSRRRKKHRFDYC